MAKKKTTLDLGCRERQIMDVIYRIGEGSVADVRAQLPDPPSYSAVRTMIRVLEAKGFLSHRRDGIKYIYRPTQSHDKVSRSAIEHLLTTFFAGSASDAMAAMLDAASGDITDDDLDRMAAMIEQARREGR